MEKTGCKIMCGAPTTLAVKGLMIDDDVKSRPFRLSGNGLGNRNDHVQF